MAKIRGGHAKMDLDLSYSLYDFLRQVNILTILIESTEKFPRKICPIGKTVCMFTLIDSAKTEAPLLRRVERWKRRTSDACWYTFSGNFPLITIVLNRLWPGREGKSCLSKSTLSKGAKYPTVNPGSALYIKSKAIQLSGSFCQKSIFDSQ